MDNYQHETVSKALLFIVISTPIKAYMKNIESLRNMAKSNLCETCFKQYKALIEPSIEELLFSPIDDWREVESNITLMVMVTKGVLERDNIYLSLDGSILFGWNKIPVRDNGRLIKFLKQNYSIDWVKIAKIEKINGDKTIKLSTEKKVLSLKLNDENTKVSLEINDGRTDEFIVKKKEKYLFSWDKIPGNDNGKLLEFLGKKYGIYWVKTVTIDKIDDVRTINVSTEKNSLSLRLNNEKTKVNVKIDDGRTFELNAKTENSKLNIYEEENNLNIYKKDKEGSNDVLGKEINWDDFQKIKSFWTFTKKIDYLHNNKILGDFSHRVLDEANQVRNKIHEPPIVAKFSEQDLNLFHDARMITDTIYLATIDDSESTKLKEAEEYAKEDFEKLS